MGSKLTFIIIIEHPYFSLLPVLRSCIDQTNQNCEVICLCTNEVFQTARQLIDSSPIPIQRLDINGLSLAQQKNSAIEHSHGEVVVFLENGHYPSPQCCDVILSLFSINQATLLYTSKELTGNDPFGNLIISERITRGPIIPQTLPFRSHFPSYTFFRRSTLPSTIRFQEHLHNPARIFFNTIYATSPNKTFYCSLPLVQQPIPQLRLRDPEWCFSYLSLIESLNSCPALYNSNDVNRTHALKQAIQPTYSNPLIIFLTKPTDNSACAPSETASNLINTLYTYYGSLMTLVPVSNHSQEKEVISGPIYTCYFYAENPHDILNKVCAMGNRIVLIAEDNKSILSYSSPEKQIIARILYTDQRFTYEPFDNIDLVIKANKITPRDAFGRSCLSTSLDDLQTNPTARNSFLKFIDTKEQERNKTVKTRCQNLKDAKLLLSEANKTIDLSLTVVICCRNVEPLRLRRCLKSLRQQDNVGFFQIILSDYGSDERHRSELSNLAQEFQAVHLYTETKAPWSRSIALNIGIQRAERDWVLTTDADMIFSSSFGKMLASYTSIFGDSCVFYAQPLKLYPVKLPEDWDNSLYREFAKKSWLFDQQGKGGCQVARKDFLTKVRGFNEVYSVWGLEDHDMYERLGWAGLEQVWVEPGWYMHQWHLSNISRTSVKNTNEDAYFALRANPKVIVNSTFWGKESPTTFLLPTAEDQSFASTGLSKEELEIQLIENENNIDAQIQILMDIVNRLLELDQYGAALQTLEDLCHLAPNNTDAYALRAMITMLLKDYGRARLLIDRTLELNPHHPQIVEANKTLIERHCF